MTVASMPMWSAVTRSIFLAARRHAAEEVAAADHHADLGRRRAATSATSSASCSYAFGVDAEAGLAGQHLAAQLQQDAFVPRQENPPRAASTRPAVSPTLKRTNRDTVMFSPVLAILVAISLPDGGRAVLDEGLLVEADFLVELVHAAFDDLVGHLRRLALGDGARALDLALLLRAPRP